jgi:hypothetical protein
VSGAVTNTVQSLTSSAAEAYNTTFQSVSGTTSALVQVGQHGRQHVAMACMSAATQIRTRTSKCCTMITLDAGCRVHPG